MLLIRERETRPRAVAPRLIDLLHQARDDLFAIMEVAAVITQHVHLICDFMTSNAPTAHRSARHRVVGGPDVEPLHTRRKLGVEALHAVRQLPRAIERAAHRDELCDPVIPFRAPVRDRVVRHHRSLRMRDDADGIAVGVGHEPIDRVLDGTTNVQSLDLVESVDAKVTDEVQKERTEHSQEQEVLNRRDGNERRQKDGQEQYGGRDPSDEIADREQELARRFDEDPEPRDKPLTGGAGAAPASRDVLQHGAPTPDCGESQLYGHAPQRPKAPHRHR